jgi:AcrR family transcriptional regulator
LSVPEPRSIVDAMTDESGTATAGAGIAAGAPARVGRKRDHTRDAAILDAATEVLGEVGYANLTVDLVAARARAGKATVYRRWASKEDLVLDAVERLGRSQADLIELPDTGTLRGDLIALFRPESAEEQARRDKAVAGLASVLAHHPAFAEAANSALVEPWADAHRVLMQRAADRGEVPAAADIATICRVLPTMAAYRTLVQRKPFDRDFLVSSIDVVLLPALLHPSGTPAAPPAGRSG